MPELMGHVDIPHKWKKFLIRRGCFYDVQSILRFGLIAGGRESREGRQTIFFTPLNPFGDNPDEEELDDDLSKPRNVHNLRDFTLPKGLTFGLVLRMWTELPTASGPKSARVYCGC